MKNYLFLLFIGALFLNCSNDDESSTKSQLIGQWNWVESSGGILGRTETPESTGKIIKLEFSNNSIKRFVNGNLESESKYSIKSEDYYGEQREIITYEEYPINQIIGLNENYLILYDMCDDCFQNEYVKE